MESKEQFIDALKTGKLKYKTLTDEERQVRVHGDAGIVSGTCRIVVTASGKEFDGRVLFTEVWVKKAMPGKWFCGTQATCSSEPPLSGGNNIITISH